MTQYQQHELSRIDGEISELEKKIAVKHEQRRELVKRMGLNKNEVKIKIFSGVVCVHRGLIIDGKCQGCGCQLSWQHTELKP